MLRTDHHPPPSVALRTWTAAALIAAALPGCDPRGPVGSGATLCGRQAGATDVFIEVSYDAQGMPAASPEDCTVPSGATVQWRGPAGASTAFEIRFKGTSPDPSEPRGVFASSPGDDRQRVSRRVGAPAGRYAYGIRANGRERDPAIIIR